jgi:hypothetical protein
MLLSGLPGEEDVVTRNEPTLQKRTASEHIVQLFDTSESLINVLSHFVTEALHQDANVLVVARPRNWDAVAVRLVQQGLPVGEAVRQSRITFLSAATTMSRFMRNGIADPGLFSDVIGTLIERLVATSPAGLYIYGEMVDLLAEEGDFHAARQFEALWNGLGARYSFTLLCAYAAAHFATPNAGSALDTICRAHSQVRADAADPLAMWLIATDSPNSKPDLQGSAAQ